MTTTVTGKGQTTIPAEFARQLGIKRGSLLDWELSNGTLKVRRIPTRAEIAAELRGLGRKLLKKDVDLLKDLKKLRDEDDKLI